MGLGGQGPGLRLPEGDGPAEGDRGLEATCPLLKESSDPDPFCPYGGRGTASLWSEKKLQKEAGT